MVPILIALRVQLWHANVTDIKVRFSWISGVCKGDYCCFDVSAASRVVVNQFTARRSHLADQLFVSVINMSGRR